MNGRLVAHFPSGRINIPPSKSLIHRALICAGLADGNSVIKNLAYSNDIRATASCMAKLGGYDGQGVLDCNESGTTLRLLIPVAAALNRSVTFTGRGRLMQRPMSVYTALLNEHGAELLTEEDSVRVSGQLTGGRFMLPGDISSQYVSGLLTALPLLREDSEILISGRLQSAPYVQLTLDMINSFGVKGIQNDAFSRFVIRGGQKYRPAKVTIEGDYSQAAFFLVAGALGSPCECAGLNPASHQGDAKIVDIIKKSGGMLSYTGEGYLSRPGRLLPQNVDVSDTPDLVPPIAALFAFCDGVSVISGAKRLRHKESDRLETVTNALNSLGADVVIDGDSLIVTGKEHIAGGSMDSYNDHRIAMMGAVAAVRAKNPVYIKNSGCVDKSYPGFWKDFEGGD